MEHSVVYLGYYPNAFGNQQVGVLQHVAKDGRVRPADMPEVAGVVFGLVEDLDGHGGKIFFWVRAIYQDIDVLLSRAVVFDRDRHTDGKGLGPTPPKFGDRSAANLLSDMIHINHPVAQQLREIATRTGLTVSP